MAPFKSPKRTQGALPLDPDIGSWALEELHALRNQVRCTWLRHESLLLVIGCNRALLRGARVTLLGRQTAFRMRHCCARRIEECLGRRQLGCTAARLAERQRMLEAAANRLATPMAASAAMPPRRYYHSAGTVLLQDRDCQCEPFSWGSKGDILFREREYPPYFASPHEVWEKPQPGGL